ncbi:g9195 [Coccomyxa elongata]
MCKLLLGTRGLRWERVVFSISLIVTGAHCGRTQQSLRNLQDLHSYGLHLQGSTSADISIADELHSSRALQEVPNFQEPATPTFAIFSALHDNILGEVRVIAEVYPLDVCESVATCQLDGPSGHHDVVAAARAPFDTWGVDQPQLRECFVICKLPEPGLTFTWVHLRDAEDRLLKSHLLEELETPRNATHEHPKKSVGMCVGPVFSAAPTFLDWLQYYADMGVEGIHMYAVVADFILSPNGGGYMHNPGNYRALSIENHRLLRWKIFHPSPWSLHYYGQWLIYNDCAFRWRHYYDYLLFVDRDEFVHFVGKQPHEVNLAVEMAARFQPTTASISFFGALYPVRCLTKRIQVLGAHGSADGKSPLSGIGNLFTQVYEGYDLWAKDKVQPNFLNCSTAYHGPNAGRACHPKSVIRPLAIKDMNVHFLAGVQEGFDEQPVAVDPQTAFLKHLRCLLTPTGSEWEQNVTAPLCTLEAKPDFAKATAGGVLMCSA